MGEEEMNIQQFRRVCVVSIIFVSTVFSQNISSSTILLHQSNLIQRLSDQVDKLYNLTVSLEKSFTELQLENDELKRNVTAMAESIKFQEEIQINFTDFCKQQVIELHQENDILKRNVTSMAETFRIFEEIQSNLTKTNIELEKELLEIKQTSSSLTVWDIKGTIFSIQNDLSGLIGSLTSIQQSMSTFKDDLTYMHNGNQLLQNKTALLTDNVMSIREALKDATTLVAFTATNTGFVNYLRDNEVIIFDKMITQVGTEYRPDTGIFTANLNGIYAFFVDIRARSGIFICWIDVVRNGQSVGTIFLHSNGTFIGDSTFVIVSLTIGDKVWIRNSHYETYACSLDSLNTFTGVLIGRG